MKNILLIFIIFITFGALGYGQVGVCGTHDHEEIFQRLEVNKRFLAENQAIYREDAVLFVPVKFHIVTKDDGTGALEEEALLTQLCRLNNDYEAHKMHFYIKGSVNYIPYTTLYEDPKAQFSTIKMAANFANNAVNVFIVNKIGTNETGTTLGYYQPGRDWIVMIQSKVGNNETLTHEIGHFFSLPHTFYGWEGCPYESSVYGLQVNLTHVPCSGELIELANGSNCGTAADKLCDTPPDFNFGLYDPEQNCRQDFDVKDLNGDVVRPMENNFMSYFSNCPAGQFTTSQKNLMRADFLSTGRNYIRSSYVPDTTIIAEEKPVITEPPFNSTVPYYDHIYVNWTDVPGANSYWIKVTVGTISKKVFYYRVNGASETTITNLPPNQTFISMLIWPYNDGNSCNIKVSETHRFKTGGISVGVEEINKTGNFRLYPNPVSDAFPEFILENNGNTETFELEVINLNGQKLFSTSQLLYTGKNPVNLSEAYLKPGMYVFRIIRGNEIINQKLSIN
jgi:hypothetical protein